MCSSALATVTAIPFPFLSSTCPFLSNDPDFQEDFYAKMQAGTMPTAEEQAAVQELGQKVEANALLKEYLAAQQGLSVYLNDIERIIFKPLQELNS